MCGEKRLAINSRRRFPMTYDYVRFSPTSLFRFIGLIKYSWSYCVLLPKHVLGHSYDCFQALLDEKQQSTSTADNHVVIAKLMNLTNINQT